MIRKSKKHLLGTVVYGVFGDTPRSDKDNIESVWFHKDLANDRLEWLKENDEYNSYHLEILEMEDSLEKLPPHKENPSEVWTKICKTLRELDFPKTDIKYREDGCDIWGAEFQINDTYAYFHITPILESTHTGQIFCNLNNNYKNILYKNYDEFEKGLDDMRKFMKDNKINLYELDAINKFKDFEERG